MTFQRSGILAALAAAATLPLAGPVRAEAEMIHLAAVETVTATVTAAAAATITSDAAPNAVAAPEVPATFEPIGSGIASYYGRELAGARTASGARFDPGALTAAHRTLPFGTRVQVTNAATGDSVIVTINDRGPFHGNRLIDLSEAAAREIGIARMGSGRVQLAVATSAE